MKYKGRKTKEISFPLGGIGSGCIGLAGNGGFRDIEIDNRPNKASSPMFTHFAVKAENKQGVVDARVMQGDLGRDYIGNLERPKYSGYGFGPDRGSMAGFPHFSNTEFSDKFPFARVNMKHDQFPGHVSLTAFNPLIPTNEDDSSLPAAFFEVEIENTSTEELIYTVALSCCNYYTVPNGNHRYVQENGLHMIHLSNYGDKAPLEDGNLTIASNCPDVSFQEYWFRGKWFDNSSVFWNQFTAAGKLKNRFYEKDEKIASSDPINDTATLAAHIMVLPKEKKSVRFVLAWSKPYMNNFWDITHIGLNEEEIAARRKNIWKNYYAVLFKDSRDTARYALQNYDRLYADSRLYADAIFYSTMPEEVIDAVTANVSILKSPTCLRLSDGSFYGFEGVHAHEGSCEGTCTHVWSYAYAPAFLFPRLERSARTNEYTYSMQKDGGMGFRVQLPLGTEPTNHRPALDGQFGTVMRVLREFKISGDLDWLKSIWPEVKRSISFAWSDINVDRWDIEKTGIPTGRQHHTLDMELFGSNSWLAGMYLGGLQAGVEMAVILGDNRAEEQYRQILERGKKQLNDTLFNGEYFFQDIDLNDKDILMPYNGGYSQHDSSAAASYWNEEVSEIKYQVGEGCAIDQVLGQWHADLLGMEPIFEPSKTRSALKAIHLYNFVPSMREHINPCRIYALDEEQGTVICSYPKGRRKPFIPVPYAEETMHGFEYQAASHMILHGLEEEGLQCVRAVRERYDGEKRNPWNEMECGSNYARSMASYALLLVYSGFKYDMYYKMIGFAPIVKGDYRFFWSVDSGFGEIAKVKGEVYFRVHYGSLSLKTFEIETGELECVELNGQKISYQRKNKSIHFVDEMGMKAGDVLHINETVL